MKTFDVIVFDLDSTLVRIEGLDWLSKHNRRSKRLQELTQKAMSGELDFSKALKIKMRAISPSFKDLTELGEKYTQTLVEDVKDVINALHYLGKEVWILTGNFQPAVGIVANLLGIPAERVICNKVFFDTKGKYRGFDTKSPLARNRGKTTMLKRVLRKRKKKIVFVGDGSTDLEASKVVDLFIGYGGVIQRKIVKNNSKVYLSRESMGPLLLLILNKEELNELEKSCFVGLLKKAERLISC